MSSCICPLVIALGLSAPLVFPISEPDDGVSTFVLMRWAVGRKQPIDAKHHTWLHPYHHALIAAEPDFPAPVEMTLLGAATKDVSTTTQVIYIHHRGARPIVAARFSVSRYRFAYAVLGRRPGLTWHPLYATLVDRQALPAWIRAFGVAFDKDPSCGTYVFDEVEMISLQRPRGRLETRLRIAGRPSKRVLRGLPVGVLVDESGRYLILSDGGRGLALGAVKI